MMRAPPSRGRLQIEHLRWYVDEGTMIAFLGAGASTLRDIREPTTLARVDAGVWASVLGRARALLDTLEEDAGTYVKAVLHAHQIEKGYESVAPLRDLLPLQTPLARLGSVLTTQLGQRMGSSVASGTHIAQGRVSLDEAPLKQVCTHLHEVLQAIDALPQDPRTPEAFFLPRPVLKTRLMALACALVGPEKLRAAVSSWWEAPYVEEVERMAEWFRQIYPHRVPGYGVEQAQWVDSLLWHTLRYDVAAYPTTSELAFQVSLLPEQAVVPSAGFAEVAELVPSRVLHARLVSILAHYEAAGAGRDLPVHRQIARLLRYYYAAKSEAFPSAKDAKGRLTVVLTTNFDREMERALEARSPVYHVLLPVQVDDEPEPRWLLKTQYAGAGADHRFLGKDPFLEQSPPDGPEEPFRPLGPLVVKLHGSPLDRLPAPSEISRRPNAKEPVPSSLRHFVVLSESSYLRSTRAGSVPQWVEDHIYESGSAARVWFLGYSVSDWNIRLWLYRHISDHGRRDGPEKYALGKRLDPERVHLLSTLRVHLVEDDLRVFAAWMGRLLDGKGVTP